MSYTDKAMEVYTQGFEKAIALYENRICEKCSYAKTSGDFYVCDLGIRMNKVWGNAPSFGCNKWRKEDDKGRS